MSIHKLCIAFGGPLLLDSVALDINKGQRICFLGRNGAGKSTFLKILAREIVPDSGEIITTPGLRVAWLPQDVPENISGPVLHIVAAGIGITQDTLIKRRTFDKEHSGDNHQLLGAVSLDNEWWKLQAKILRVLEQVGLDADADMESLSGGMRRRVLLARALVSEPELLLLDEPTNHLDIESIQWLESFLLNSRMTVMFVTHDRRLLKRIATRIVELDRGKLVDWSCDYETFLARKQAVLDAEQREWDRFDKKLAQEEVWIRRGIKARRTRNEGRVRALIGMREQRRKRRERSGIVSMAISEAQRTGEIVLDAQEISFSYSDIYIIRKFSTIIARGDRIGIIGPNGSGKTTLINLLVGKLTPAEGVLKFGTHLMCVYFDQLREILVPEKTVWENVAPNGGDTVFVNGAPKHVISYLQDFLFTPDRAKSPVKQLSGGERNRLLLARIFAQPSNVLVFDEPTNDLDTETLELLEEILLEYKGTILVVSHDREFLNNVVTSTFAFEGKGIVKEYVGGYDDWERQRPSLQLEKVPEKPAKPKKQSDRIDNQAARKKLSFREKADLLELPSKIESLELELESLNIKMADPEHFQKSGFITMTKEHIARIEKELETAYGRWEELESRESY